MPGRWPSVTLDDRTDGHVAGTRRLDDRDRVGSLTVNHEVILNEDAGLTDVTTPPSQSATVRAQPAVAVATVMPVGSKVAAGCGWSGTTGVLRGRLGRSWDGRRPRGSGPPSVPAVGATVVGPASGRSRGRAVLPGVGTRNDLAVHSVEVGCLASQWIEQHLEAEGVPASAWRTERDLKDANDLANTHKHAGRKPEKRIGRVLSYEAPPGGTPTITLAFVVSGSDVVETRDALELLQAWEGAWEGLAHAASGITTTAS
jgi:hypothetical protein